MPSFMATARAVLLAGQLGIRRVEVLEVRPRGLTSFSLEHVKDGACPLLAGLARISTPLSPDQAMEAPTPRKVEPGADLLGGLV